jgi:hypothetical protein
LSAFNAATVQPTMRLEKTFGTNAIVGEALPGAPVGDVNDPEFAWCVGSEVTLNRLDSTQHRSGPPSIH